MYRHKYFEWRSRFSTWFHEAPANHALCFLDSLTNSRPPARRTSSEAQPISSRSNVAPVRQCQRQHSGFTIRLRSSIHDVGRRRRHQDTPSRHAAPPPRRISHHHHRLSISHDQDPPTKRHSGWRRLLTHSRATGGPTKKATSDPMDIERGRQQERDSTGRSRGQRACESCRRTELSLGEEGGSPSAGYRCQK